MVIVEQINNSQICYFSEPDIHIRDYYLYCLNFLKKEMSSTDESLNIIFGKIHQVFDNKNPVYKFDLQIEHTLVKASGRGVKNQIFGSVEYGQGEYYLVRLLDDEYLNGIDFIIDYSRPNITNITNSNTYSELAKKFTYISPFTMEIDFGTSFRNGIISTFTKNGSHRRTIIENQLIGSISEYENFTDVFEKSKLQTLYDKTKILINVHQTDHHHTFEELRVLPALCRGTLVVSEDVPLKEHIPYNEFIIWSTYEDLVDKVIEVEKNYDYFYKKIFTKKNKNKLIDLKNINEKKINNLKLWKNN